MRQLADQSVLGGWRSSLFVFRQTFVLYPGIVAALAFAGWMLSLMAANGRTSPNNVVMLLAIAPIVGLGFAVLIGLSGFMIHRAFSAKRPDFSPDEGENVLAKERANHFLGDEARGGELTLTDRRLVFVPHRFNVQLASIEQSLARVRDIEWSRIVTAMGTPLAAPHSSGPVLSTVLHVIENDRRERYVVRDASGLGAQIEQSAERAVS